MKYRKYRLIQVKYRKYRLIQVKYMKYRLIQVKYRLKADSWAGDTSCGLTQGSRALKANRIKPYFRFLGPSRVKGNPRIGCPRILE